MSTRQARRERREAERKAKKAEIRRAKAAGESPVHIPSEAPHSRALPQLDVDPEGLPMPAAEPLTFSEEVYSRLTTAAELTLPPSPRTITNRANAQHSTGPRTAAGKLASSRNSLKHGLSNATLIIPGEDPAALQALRDLFIKDLQPANETESLVVEQMAHSWWLTQRALRFQDDCFSEDGVNQQQLTLFLRYQTTHERAFYKAVDTLRRLQKERRQTGRGLVSQKRPQTAAPHGFVSQHYTQPDPEIGFESQNGHEDAPQTFAASAARATDLQLSCR